MVRHGLWAVGGAAPGMGPRGASTGTLPPLPKVFPVTADYRCGECGHMMSAHVAAHDGTDAPLTIGGCSVCECTTVPIRETDVAQAFPKDTTPIQDGAATLHEVFMAYVRAGFRREEALELVKVSVTQAMDQVNGEGGEG